MGKFYSNVSVYNIFFPMELKCMRSDDVELEGWGLVNMFFYIKTLEKKKISVDRYTSDVKVIEFWFN